MEYLSGERTSLANDLDTYGDITERLREILVQAEADAHHVEHYLEADSLVTPEAIEK